MLPLLRLSILLLAGLLPGLSVTAQVPQRFDIIISELFPDPSPVIGLPNSEFIELKNVSATPFHLQNWKISDGSSTAVITEDFVLQPDSFVIICARSAATSFAPLGRTIGVSNFPSLNNEGDVITLYSPEDRVIHSVDYTNNWYGNDIKSNGGWTLEIIDTHNPCNGISNWKASTHPDGGTPGKVNTVDGNNPDLTTPVLKNVYIIDSLTLTAVFDEPLDSISASVPANYVLNNSAVHPLSVIPLPPSFNEVLLKLPATLLPNTVYQLTVNNISDCAGNTVGSLNTARYGIPSVADSFDIIINEILFNPASGGYDYIELYNRSRKIIDLSQLYIANRNGTSLVNSKVLSSAPQLFFPGDYIVITENSQWLKQQYLLKDAAAIIEIPALPSMPDDKGAIAVTNYQGHISDELHYNAKWHFALISNEEGVALERINYNEPTQNSGNWTSAASTVLFGTPGYQNSQFRADLQAQGLITVVPQVFSPDNNGFDDYATIQYQVTEPGYVANITIFDVSGRPVRYLARNAVLGLAGTFKWDGLDEKSNKLPVGIYIVVTEVFNLQGKTRKFKNTVTLAGRF